MFQLPVQNDIIIYTFILLMFICVYLVYIIYKIKNKMVILLEEKIDSFSKNQIKNKIKEYNNILDIEDLKNSEKYLELSINTILAHVVYSDQSLVYPESIKKYQEIPYISDIAIYNTKFHKQIIKRISEYFNNEFIIKISIYEIKKYKKILSSLDLNYYIIKNSFVMITSNKNVF